LPAGRAMRVARPGVVQGAAELTAIGSGPGGMERREGRALCSEMQRAARRTLLRAVASSARGVTPETHEEITVGAALCPPGAVDCPRRSLPCAPVGWLPLAPRLTRQRDLGVDEAGKVFDRSAKRPVAGSVRSRARSIRLDRVRVRRSPPDSGAPTPMGATERFAENRTRCGRHSTGGIRNSCSGSTVAAATTPTCRHRPPRARSFAVR
jgi:hypothetical protein